MNMSHKQTTASYDTDPRQHFRCNIARLSEILSQLSETDMLLMDESFSSTSGLEAGYIASEVLTGIGLIFA